MDLSPTPEQEALRAAADAERRSHPLVEAALEAFPDAEFVSGPEPSRAGSSSRNWSQHR